MVHTPQPPPPFHSEKGNVYTAQQRRRIYKDKVWQSSMLWRVCLLSGCCWVYISPIRSLSPVKKGGARTNRKTGRWIRSFIIHQERGEGSVERKCFTSPSSSHKTILFYIYIYILKDRNLLGFFFYFPPDSSFIFLNFDEAERQDDFGVINNSN